MNFRRFEQMLRTSARIPVTRDEEFVRRIAGDSAAPRFAAPRTSLLRRLSLSFTAAAFAFSAFVTGFLGLHPDVIVTIDSNPAIELRINHFDRVIGLSALNADADAVVAAVDYWNADPETVLADLHDELVAQGYLAGDGVLLLGIAGVDEADGLSYETSYLAALGGATVVYMNAYDFAATGTLTFKSSSAFEASVETADAERAYVWGEIFDAAATVEPGSTDGVVTTTAAWNGDPEDLPDVFTFVAIELSAAEFASVAESFGVTEAKLRLAIAVFNGYSAYRTMTDLEMLARSPIAVLNNLYQAIPE